MTTRRHSTASGFTLLEILIAVSIAVVMLTSVIQVFDVSLQAREEVTALSEPMTAGPRILDLVEEDLHALWTGNVKDNRVLRGENRDVVGDDADRLHLLVAGTTLNGVRLPNDSTRRADLAEVSWLVKTNPRNPYHLELWRREDPMVDNEWERGGFYQLLSDRVRGFNITYFEDLGKEAEPLDKWDAAEKAMLPRRVKIELQIERSSEAVLYEVEDVGKRVDNFVRHIVLDPRRVNSLTPGIAMLPIVPEGPPTAENAQAGGGGARGGDGGLVQTRTGAGAGARDGKGAQPGPGGRTPRPGTGGPGVPNPGGNINLDQLMRQMGGAGQGGGRLPGLGGNQGGGRQR